MFTPRAVTSAGWHLTRVALLPWKGLVTDSLIFLQSTSLDPAGQEQDAHGPVACPSPAFPLPARDILKLCLRPQHSASPRVPGHHARGRLTRYFAPGSGLTASVPRFPHPLKKKALDGDSLGDAVRRQRVPASERLRGVLTAIFHSIFGKMRQACN